MADATEPEIVRDAREASEWIAVALASSGYRADFSLESLKEIDRFLDDHTSEGTPKPDGLLSEQFGSRMFALGAYVGEVLRRKRGGQWLGDDTDPQAAFNLILELKPGEQVWPIQRVMKRFKNGAEDGIYTYGIVIVGP